MTLIVPQQQLNHSSSSSSLSFDDASSTATAEASPQLSDDHGNLRGTSMSVSDATETTSVVVGTNDSSTGKEDNIGETAASSSNDDNSSFHWTVATIVQSIVIFLAAGIAEIGGGWLVWQAVREGKPAWWAVLGSLVLIGYGFIPTLQPTESFGRVYAVYGGFFIVLSFLWGWLLDGQRPDRGDAVGGAISIVGVLVILLWPR